MHHKNRDAIIRMTRNHELIISNKNEEFVKEYDCVFIPSGFYKPTTFPKSQRIVYGPNNFVFAKEPWILEPFDSRCV